MFVWKNDLRPIGRSRIFERKYACCKEKYTIALKYRRRRRHHHHHHHHHHHQYLHRVEQCKNNNNTKRRS